MNFTSIRKRWRTIPSGISTVLFALLVISCTQKKDVVKPSISTNSIYVINEGLFPSGNGGGISYINKDSLKVTLDLYNSANGTSLGGQSQSLTFINGKGYIVVQSLGVIRVVNLSNFVSSGSISTGLTGLSPRYLVEASDGIAYVSDWKTNNILVVNLNNNTLQSQITSSGVGPDFMLRNGNKVFVSFNGGYSNDNRIGVINTSTNQIEKYITVGASPSSMVLDANGKIWVICEGAYNSSYTGLETSASLYRIDPATSTVELSLSFNDLAYEAKAGSLNINADRNTLYYRFKGKAYKMDISSASLPNSAFINRDFYGISVDPGNNQIIGCVSPSFTAAGRIIRYQPSGVAIDSFAVGIGPARCVFY